jgi:hypothetical protein
MLGSVLTSLFRGTEFARQTLLARVSSQQAIFPMGSLLASMIRQLTTLRCGSNHWLHDTELGASMMYTRESGRATVILRANIQDTMTFEAGKRRNKPICYLLAAVTKMLPCPGFTAILAQPEGPDGRVQVEKMTSETASRPHIVRTASSPCCLW